jgi:ABC 3 transport family
VRLSGLMCLVAVVSFALMIPGAVEAARINELSDSTLMDRTVRFFTFKDPSLRNALAGSMLLGVCCGLMGTFLVVRKLSLLGDALSHAVLPGVALGFLWNMSKDPLAIFVGATLAGLLEPAPCNFFARRQGKRRMPPWALCLPRSSAWESAFSR